MSSRLAIVTPVYPNSAEPLRGIFTYHAARALQAWAEVAVDCLLASYLPIGPLKPRERRYTRVDPGFRTLGVPVRYVQYPAVPVVSRALNPWVAARWLRPHLERDRPDLVLAYWVHPEGTAALRAARSLGIPVVIGALGTDLRGVLDPLARRATVRTLREADFVVTVSGELSRRAVDLGAPPERVRTIVNGCDGAVFHPQDRAAARAALGVPADARLVLFVGHLIPQKGLRELFMAVDLVHRSQPRLELAVIGEGPLDGELRSSVIERGRQGRIRMLGRQEPAGVARWLAAADVLCLPSHSEGCPNVVLEALYSGRPVVATDVGGIPELVDETCGILVPKEDVPALADALARALARPWDAEAISRTHGRTWDDVARETFEVCRAVLDGRTGGSQSARRTM